ncbi:hypothetical protein FPQ18DRAFT_306393 [Pyronema domesticum]|uniref:Uncharacterized protein n=1 Tax=Pyronema omphalodes (strain CBS 100304) TaxID=1076935 RepID=U4LBR0_PYROM|nr:hypothetical protein FPQ18DRAFT_306393 [Pyronema domesticum]CCX07742.1 Protein of unknown function [Pyronema omphalodes CBS 100304]
MMLHSFPHHVLPTLLFSLLLLGLFPTIAIANTTDAAGETSGGPSQAGIAVGIIAGALLVFIGGYYIIKRRKSTRIEQMIQQGQCPHCNSGKLNGGDGQMLHCDICQADVAASDSPTPNLWSLWRKARSGEDLEKVLVPQDPTMHHATR